MATSATLSSLFLSQTGGPPPLLSLLSFSSHPLLSRRTPSPAPLLAPPLTGTAPRTPSRRCRSSHPRRRRQAPPSLSSPPCGAMAGPHPPLLPAQAAELARVPAAGRGGAGSPARVPAAARRSARRGGAGSLARAPETAGRGGQIRPAAAAASLPRGGARRAPPWRGGDAQRRPWWGRQPAPELSSSSRWIRRTSCSSSGSRNQQSAVAG